jgi:uncharacterized protein YyaL (SSP411 family)
MIASLAMGARILNQPEYKRAAQKAADFILSTMRRNDSRLFHRFRDKEVAVNANANDYAFLILGLLELYTATYDPSYLEEATVLQKLMLDDFWDYDQGGFYLTAEKDHELPVRPKELYDGAIPSSNSVAIFNLLRLSRFTGDPNWEQSAQALVRAFSGSVANQPTAFTYFLVGLDFALNPGREVVVTGESEAPDVREMLAALNLNFSPNKITLFKSEEHADRLSKIASFTKGLETVEGKSTAYVCKNFSCTEPTTDVQTMLDHLLRKKS